MALASHPDTKPPADSTEPPFDQDESPYGSPEPEDELDSSGAKMSFLDHLDELRKRLIVSASSLAAAFVAMFIPLPPRWSPPVTYVYDFIMRPLQEALPTGGTLIYTEPTEAFFLTMKIGALAALVLAAPVILWQVWLFVAPGLYSREKKFAVPFVLFSTIFFVVGALFSHYMVFPFAWRFFASFTTEYMTFMPRIQPTFSLYVKLLLTFGLIFQLPTLVFFLARIGVVTPRFLIRNFKYAVLISFVVSAILTPTGDAVVQSLMAGPMIGLYIISIGIAWLFAKRPST